MIDTKDIRDKIESDFGDKASEVYKIFDEAFAKANYLNVNRTIRCILFLADKDIEKLKNNIKAAICGPRDIMLWAEYSNEAEWEKMKRLRNFNKTFEQAGKGVKE